MPNLNNIDADAFNESSTSLKYFDVQYTAIGDAGFPFGSLASYISLLTLYLKYSNLTKTPTINSTSIQSIYLDGNNIDYIDTL